MEWWKILLIFGLGFLANEGLDSVVAPAASFEFRVKTVPSNMTPSLSPPSSSTPPSPSFKSPWCPGSAKCHDTPLCHSCQQRFLVILSTGRSASTTLQQMLGSLPGVRMAGENNHQLGALQKLVYNTKGSPDWNTAGAYIGSWQHGNVTTYACLVQDGIETINPPTQEAHSGVEDTILGFKTIRFCDDAKNDYQLRNMVQFLKENLPCSKVVVNLRSDVEAQQKSRDRLGMYSLDLAEANMKHLKTTDMLGDDWAMLLDSDVWLKNITVLNEVVEWLGFSEECKFTELLEFNTHDYWHGKQVSKMDPKCHYLHS